MNCTNKNLFFVCIFMSAFLFLLQLFYTTSLNKQRHKLLKIVYNNPCSASIRLSPALHKLLVDIVSEGDIEAATMLVNRYMSGCNKNISKVASGIKSASNSGIPVRKELELSHNELDMAQKSAQLQKISTSRPVCTVQSLLLQGHIPVNISESKSVENGDGKYTSWPPTLDELELKYQNLLQLGGLYSGPVDCICRSFNAIIVPYRDREKHLRYFLYYIHQLLQRQQLCYAIIVSEQADNRTFNKGQLMNTAFKYAKSFRHFDCYIFHDVDVIAEDDRVMYTCKEDAVVHLGAYIDKYNYTVKNGLTVGAAVGFTEEQYSTLNGYSNEYAGWGGEDDDMYERISAKNMTLWRPNPAYSRFKMIKHKKDTGNPDNKHRFVRLHMARNRQSIDGINTLDTTIVDSVLFKTHVRLKVATYKNLLQRDIEGVALKNVLVREWYKLLKKSRFSGVEPVKGQGMALPGKIVKIAAMPK